ncbi:RecQ family ATP-dependent DNA helicase [Patulibacter americanus]|uniref:RecQ family ATP-dependent DNA helicase n=1 Tax=Patulibacter americanus TaxID=588672 RepID=UPI00041BB51A|nr:RecQ family ATP-dependent DNA helicase [Patulibacter americanus]
MRPAPGGYLRSVPEDMDALAHDVLGIDELRPEQREALDAITAGRDTLAVMATGSGKSAIYQLAGLQLDGPTVVVSPLIALQQDQVEGLHATSGDADLAVTLNSQMSAARRREALTNLGSGATRFVLLSPEQLANAEVLEELAAVRPALFVVDEAHCISEWGHDFRPDYLRLGAARTALSGGEDAEPLPVLALTATAAPPVRDEIIERLFMRSPAIVVGEFDRPELWLEVRRYEEEGPKDDALLDTIEETEGAGLVYVATRRAAEETADALRARGVDATHYHGGMHKGEREAVLRAFLADEVRVVVATIAFGMGVDKPNVRWVFHHAPSSSLDAYLQEIGRAGRDGDAAQAILFYRPQDLGLRRFQAGAGQVDADQIERVATVVTSYGDPVDPACIAEELHLSASKVTTAVSRLEDAGALELLPDGQVAPLSAPDDLEQAVEEAERAGEHRHAYEESRIAMVRTYAETRDCRREVLLSYFGEDYEGPCGACDNCAAGRSEEHDETDRPFPIGAEVAHREWGPGVVQRYGEGQMTVLFEDAGYRTLGVDLVVQRELLKPLEA